MREEMGRAGRRSWAKEMHTEKFTLLFWAHVTHTNTHR